MKLAMPGLRMVDLNAARGSFYSEHLALQMKRVGIEVVTEREIATLLGMERQKQLLGCTEESTGCIAEIANAMGTQGVVLGDIARLGGSFQVNLKVISARDGKTLAVFSERVGSEEDALDALTRGARQLARELGVERAEPSSAPGPTRFWWAPVVAGAVGVGIGAALLGQADSRSAPLRSATPSSPLLISDAERIGREAGSFQTGGAIALGLGLALVAAGGVMAVLHLTRVPQVAVVFSADGGGLVFSGRWP